MHNRRVDKREVSTRNC